MFRCSSCVVCGGGCVCRVASIHLRASRMARSETGNDVVGLDGVGRSAEREGKARDERKPRKNCLHCCYRHV